MRAICLYLHIHQPIRYREYSFFDISNDANYYNGEYNGRQSNERIFRKVIEISKFLFRLPVPGSNKPLNGRLS